ncbi:MAG TPA: YbhN family protein [Thermoanaerobaculia bacterium]|nr:YbhN family protein [Thermoanaerobaculia bacterium]
MSEHADEPRPLKLRILRAVPVLLILGLLVHFLLPRLDSIENSVKTMQTLAPWAIVLSLVMQTLSYVANGALLQAVVKLGGGRMSFRRAAAIEMGAASVAIVAAGVLGFGAAIYRWARDGGVSAQAAMVASWLPSVFDSAALVLFALISGIELILVHKLSRLTVIALVIVVSLLTLAIVLATALLARNDWMKAISKAASRIVKRFRPQWDDSGLKATVRGASSMWEKMRRGAWLRPACCSMMVLTFDLLTLRYAFLATGHSLHLSLLLAGYGVPLLLGRASFLPGGIAVVEVAMAALYGGLGVPTSVAVVAVLTYRLISFWLPSLLGIPIAITLHSSKRTPPAVPA